MDKESRKLKREVRKSENLIKRVVFKSIFVILALALQIAVFFALYTATGLAYQYRFFIYNLIRVVAIIYLLCRHDTAQYKIPWILFIMFIPVLGICVYVFWGNNRIRRRKQMEIKEIENNTNYLFDDSFEIDNKIKNNDKLVYNMLQYIQNITSYPVCGNVSSKYYDLGEKLFKDLIQDLVKREIITEIEAQNINPYKIVTFTKSNIWKQLKTAKKVYRERPFFINIPAKEIYDQEVEEEILVQGIIDLYYINQQDELILVDYKTDYVEEGKEKELINKYITQLQLYKNALEESLGKKVSKTYIYSVYLGKEIEIG